MLTPETTIAIYFELSYRPRRLNGAARSSVRCFHSAIDQLAKFLGRVPTLSDLTDEVIADFAMSRIAAGRAAGTVRRYAAVLCAVWRFAASEAVLSFWPSTLRVPNYAFSSVALRVYRGE